jgi:hypothetical protein
VGNADGTAAVDLAATNIILKDAPARVSASRTIQSHDSKTKTAAGCDCLNLVGYDVQGTV